MTKISTKQKKQIAILIAFAVLSFFVYESPSDNNWTNNTEGAIKKASLFAGYIRSGRKDALAPFVTGLSKARLESDSMPSMMDIVVWSELQKKDIKPPMHHFLWAPAVADFRNPEKSVQLIILERKDSFFVLTFAGVKDDWSSNTLYKDGKPMVVSIAIRYFSGGEDNSLRFLLRKFFNLDWMPDFLKKNGEKGDWVILDYGYSFTTREYYDWVKENGPRLYSEAEARKDEFMKTINDGSFMKKIHENTEKSLGAADQWSDQKLKSQFENVGRQLLVENQ